MVACLCLGLVVCWCVSICGFLICVFVCLCFVTRGYVSVFGFCSVLVCVCVYVWVFKYMFLFVCVGFVICGFVSMFRICVCWFLCVSF